MTVTLREPFAPRVAERRPTDLAPLDHSPTSAVGWAPPTNGWCHVLLPVGTLVSTRAGASAIRQTGCAMANTRRRADSRN